MCSSRRRLPYVFTAAVLLAAASTVQSASPLPIWNANTSSVVTYESFSPNAKQGDWVYLDSHQLHPTQICLGYREFTFRAADLSAMNADKASHDPKAGVYPFLAKKDIPIIIGPDGTPYLSDGHHTLAALIASKQPDKTAFGHIVASFYGKSQAEFLAYMENPKNNMAYLYGPEGNGLSNTPTAVPFSKLPSVIYGDTSADRMANDVYRSLGWGMKDSGYASKPPKDAGRDAEILFENFIEFRWADLFRNKITWNDASDDSYYVAVANADALAHSELTTDLSGGFAARDLSGFIAAKPEDAYSLHITNENGINGDICPSAVSTNSLAVNARADTSLTIAGKLSHLAHLEINGGGVAHCRMEKGQLNPSVTIAPGSGLIILAAENDYAGPTHIKAGTLMVNGSIADSAVIVEPGTVLNGSGRVGPISGGGLISPGSSTGILTAPSLNPTSGLKFAFEFSAMGEPNYARRLSSRNDLIALTSADAFQSPLTAKNEVDVYLKADAIHPGDAFEGGFFVPTAAPFTGLVAGATYHYFLADPAGLVTFGKARYRPVESSQFSFLVNVVSVTADFSSGSVKGYMTRFTAAPAHAAAN